MNQSTTSKNDKEKLSSTVDTINERQAVSVECSQQFLCTNMTQLPPCSINVDIIAERGRWITTQDSASAWQSHASLASKH